MQDDIALDKKLTAYESDRLMHSVMRRQAQLILMVAAVFIVVLVFIPLFNLLAPDVAAKSIVGFPLTWLLLGVLFYPITWALSAYFVKKSDQIEAEISQEHTK